MTKKYADNKKESDLPLHPNQTAMLDKLSVEAKRLHCQPYEARLLLAKELLSNFLREYESTETFRKATESGWVSAVMKFVSANAWIQAQAIISAKYPIYNVNGVELKPNWGYSNDSCPHLSLQSDIVSYSRDVFEEAKICLNIEINLTDGVKNGIVTRWGYLRAKDAA